MTDMTTGPAHGARVGFRRIHPARLPGALALTLALTFALSGCGDFHLSMSELDISPKPARPGDMVVASFILNLIPAQSHTIIVVIDSTEHMRVTSTEIPRTPIMIDLGDAADLIAQYGAGEHAAYVRVNANESNEAARTRWTLLLLEETTP